MKQKFILETLSNRFEQKINNHLKEGYHLKPGSLYVANIETDIDADNFRITNSVDIIFACSLISDYGEELFVMKNEAREFKKYVNKLLESGHKYIIGSTYIASQMKSNYDKNTKKLMQSMISGVIEKGAE